MNAVDASWIGRDKREIDTPALLLDLGLFQANIERIAETCRINRISWRPHMKAAKSPAIAHKLIQAGAIGVTCAKLSEAAVLASAGIGSILIANEIVGPRKIAKLLGLLRHAEIIVAVDSTANVAMLDEMARSAGARVPVVIEVDTGMNRAGVEPGPPVLDLAREIAGCSGLRFKGVMTWEAPAAAIMDPEKKRVAVTAALMRLMEGVELCRQDGIPVDIVSCGGTGTYWASAACPGVTEIQAGGGIFGDLLYREGYGIDQAFALTIMTTVISRPTPTRIVCDAGKKAMSGDAALPAPIGLAGVKSVRLSAEHVTVELESESRVPEVGDPLEFIVGYSDTTIHLHEVIWGVRDGRVELAWPVLGRGCLQ